MSEFEDTPVETTQNETQREEKTIENNEQSLSELWDSFKEPREITTIFPQI